MSDSLNKQIILIVDDTPDNIDVLSGLLKDDYKVKAALSGERALKIAQTHPQPNLVLLDVMMPEMDGYEVCRRLKEHPDTAHIPVIFVTAKNSVTDERHGFEVGGVDYISKPITPVLVQARIKTQLELADQKLHLEALVKERTQEIEALNSEIEATQKEIVFTLGSIAETRSKETGNHVKRVAQYSYLLAKLSGFSEAEANRLKEASPMHDIGKVAIPDAILNKPGRLTPEERVIMETHARIGYEMLNNSARPLMKAASIVALEHHEKWNGTGYPNKLAGENIHIYGRITALADVFDALGSKRVYKDAWDDDKIFELFQAEKAQHFDPDLIELFFANLAQFLTIREQFKDIF